jgi:hypothetical protein
MTRTVAAYLAERVRPRLFVPVLSTLWLTALWASETLAPASLKAGSSTYTLSLLLLTLLVAQFRLWDDLEDRDHDRRSFPDRVLVRSTVEPFRWLLAILTVGAIAAAAAASLNALAGVVGLDLLFLVAYRVVRPRVPDLVWRFPVLLAKYPAFVALTAMAMRGATGRRLALATVVVMTGACFYEATHRGRQPAGVTS